MYNKDWAVRIKVEKFRTHNQQWLDMVESITVDPTNYLLQEDDEIPSLLSRDILMHTMLFPSGKPTKLKS